MLYPITPKQSVYKFNVDILIQGESNVAALEQLLHMLQTNPEILDLRVQSGIELGSLLEMMETMQQQKMNSTPFGKLTAMRIANQSSAPRSKSHAPHMASNASSVNASVVRTGANPEHAGNAPMEKGNIGSMRTMQHEADRPSAAAAPSQSTTDTYTERLTQIERKIMQNIEQNCLVRLSVNKGKGVRVSLPCRFLNYDATNQLLNVYHVDQKQVYAYHLSEIEEMNQQS
ncbi:hypothetical protein [Paenibacillus apiarius]|uniref:hypothetical protein n=1 Tax=Paenibacillus apiarius TaxID=46240 RepID=UPI00197E25A1|nr:hypothetical protein [Paenibacillus apiarius]MBN3522958.1 hypothetical protein [Paenibacillus apiarius]